MGAGSVGSVAMRHRERGRGHLLQRLAAVAATLALAGHASITPVAAESDPIFAAALTTERTGIAQSAQAGMVQQVSFDIPAQSLASALTLFGRQSGLQIAADSELIAGLQTQGLQGRFTAEQGLRRLLAGTALGYRFTSAGAVTLERAVAEPESGPLRLGDITVTARRTEELVQDVPGSVFVLPSQELEKSNVQDLEDVGLLTPNLNVGETGDRANRNISIRGISSQLGTQATGPVVGVYVDEVLLNPTGSTIGIDPNLFDLERAEVLYGPQGTAFGRGTIGGAINYVTKKPTEDFEAELEGEVGSHPDGLVRGLVNGSLTGDRTLMARLVAFGQYDDGFIDTPLTGGSIDSHDYGARLGLRSQPTDRLTLDLTGSFDRTDYNESNLATVDSLEGNGGFELLINDDGENRIDRGLVTLRGAYDFDVGSLISNTSYLNVESTSELDTDASEIDFLFASIDRTDESIAQELRFESDVFPAPLLGETNFLLGVGTTWAETETKTAVFSGSAIGAVPPGTLVDEGKAQTKVFDAGVFGELRFRPIEKLELAVGGRFTYNEVETSEEGFGSVSESFVNFSPKGSILYEWTDNVSTYTLVSTGFKSGGFNTLGTGPLSGRAFDNETAINYEGGIKSRWLDDRLFVNIAGFALYYEDLQVGELVPISPTAIAGAIDNAASARSLGAEFEMVALPLTGLQLNLNYGYADARFIDYEDSPRGDLSDEPLPNAPRHTLSFVADYSYPLFDDFADAFIRSEYSFTSSVENVLATTSQKRDRFDVLNLRLGVRADRFDIEAFVENLLDEKYATGAIGSAAIRQAFGVSDVVEVGTRRRFGVRARVRF